MSDLRPNPIVVKIGGSLIQNMDQLKPFWQALQQLHQKAPVVLVHGGGAQATAMARRLDHEPKIVEGRRVTSDLDLNIVLWTMCGQLNTQLVAQASQHDLPAIGLTGADGKTLQVTKRPPWTISGESVDFGWVGDIQQVNTTLLQQLFDKNLFPIMSPLGIDEKANLYNVNADTIACSVAQALNASEFLLVTDSGGVQRNIDDPASRLEVCTQEIYQTGKDEGWIVGGMQVKLHTAFEALEGGVSDVHILAPDDLAKREQGTKVIA